MANLIVSEIQLISKVLETQDKTIVTDTGLTPEYFDTYSKQFKFIVDHYDKYKVIPSKETFLSEFNDFEFASANESTDYLVKVLGEGRTERALKDKFIKMRELLMTGKLDDAIALEAQKVESGDLNYLKNVPNILTQEEANARFEEYRQKAENLDDYFMPTGIPEFDRAFGGGWDRREELATFVARPGEGKSWLLDNAIVAASNAGFRCGVYSGEMTKYKVSYRIDTLRSHISNTAISHGKRDVQTDYQRYIENITKDKAGDIFIATVKEDFGGNIPTIKDFGNFIEKYNLDVLFIDQLSLMTDIANTKNFIDRMGNIAQELKTLQTLYHIPIITVCQQNRGSNGENANGEANEPDVSRIAGSDKIGQYMTIVIFLERNKDLGTLKLIPAKVRDGGGKPEKYAWDIDAGIFEHIADEEGFEGTEASEEMREEFEGQDSSNIDW